MNSGFQNLSAMEYPGRILIIGRAGGQGEPVVIYAITGRSPSSQARRLEWKEDGVWVRPTDEKTIREGNVDLLVYPAMLYFRGGVAVSNGKQTSDVRRALEGNPDPLKALSSSLASWEYEPDAPIFTPRISGCLVPGPAAALGLIRRGAEGEVLRSFHKIPLAPGKGKMIMTYEGANRDPLLSFAGAPADVEIEGGDASSIAEAVYEALKPRLPEKDFRVAVSCLVARDIAGNAYEVSIINRHERN
ncbi:MAG: IMP cyclohydrolase [Candidatus Aminicenantales bacterium]